MRCSVCRLVKPAPNDVKTDVLRADECGRTAMETFIKERLVDI